MSNALKCTSIALCLVLMSCARSKQPAPEPPSAPSPAPTSQVRSATDEPGDTSPADFAGTFEPQEKLKPNQHPGVLKEVRFGQHQGYDRVVFEFTSKEVPGFKVQYADEPVVTCGSGEPVKVEGEAKLVIQLTPAQAHNDQGNATITERDSKPALKIVRQARLSCDFEAEVSWVLGLTERRAYRVREFKDPARLVIDIKHSGTEITQVPQLRPTRKKSA